VIEALGLSKRYGTLEAVREVSFTVGGGEIVGLLGPNGAGKTTIMKILTCSLFPTRGTARVNGHDVLDEPLAVKESVGYLPENAPLYPDLTVREYLGFIGEARGMSKNQRAQGLDRVVEECGLASVIHRGIDELSKGYRQRTGLAQALIHDPRILILDEPTSGLDPHQIVEIRELIRRLGTEKTVILSSHILQEVEATCQRVLILNAGRIVAQGTREEMERGMRGEVLLDVTVTTDAGAALDTSALASAAGVRRVISQESGGDGRTIIRLSLAPDAGAEERVFDWAVRSGVKIIAMVPQRLSLEDIFITLTEQGADQ
jgi:ABC-2 type transport system ATP-binding protein